MWPNTALFARYRTQGLGHRGVGRGHQTPSRCPSHDVPLAGRRVGGARDRERRARRAAPNSSSTAAMSSGGAIGAAPSSDSPYWKRVNDAMLKNCRRLTTRSRRRSRRAVVYRRRRSRSLGRPKDCGHTQRCPYSENSALHQKTLFTIRLPDSRFVYLWSGKYDYRSPSNWDADRPKYEEQMAH